MDMDTRALLEEQEEKTGKWRTFAIAFAFGFVVLIILTALMGHAKLKYEGQAKELAEQLEAVESGATTLDPKVDQIAQIDDLELDGWAIELKYNGTYSINMDRNDVTVYLNNIEDRDDIAPKFMEIYAIGNVTGAD